MGRGVGGLLISPLGPRPPKEALDEPLTPHWGATVMEMPLLP